MLLNNKTTITPIFSEGLNVNEEQTFEFTDVLYNNSSIELNLSNLTFNLKYTLFDKEYIVNSVTPISLFINWGDNSEESIKYILDPEQDITLETLPTHYYNIANSDNENIKISCQIKDAIGNNYIFVILIKLTKQSFYDMDFELDIEKAIFNNDTSTVVFSVKDISENNSNPKLSTYTSPIISVLC